MKTKLLVGNRVRAVTAILLAVGGGWSCASEKEGAPANDARSGKGGSGGTVDTGGAGGSKAGHAGRGGSAGEFGSAGEAGGDTARGGSSGGKGGRSGTAGASAGASAGAAGVDEGGAGGSAGSDGGEGGETTGEEVPARFVSVDMTDAHWCGILDDGRIKCSRAHEFGESSPPAGHFTRVEVGSSHGCGLRDDGQLVCFGSEAYGATAPPSGTFTWVSTKYETTCAVGTDGAVTCWGGVAPPTLVGTFTEVSVTGGVCGIRTDGTLACDGAVPTTLYPPTGTYRHLSRGGWHACAITTVGTVACWGGDYGELNFQRGTAILPLSGTFESVSAGDYENGYTCGLRTDGSIVCWSVTHPVTPPTVIAVDLQTTEYQGTYEGIAVGEETICVLRDGLVLCGAPSALLTAE